MSTEKYLQPDGLRGLLTLFVIAAHWLPEALGSAAHPTLMRGILLTAEMGMYFFFVLSGFLISGILIRNRLQAEMHGVSKLSVWKNYFIRRTLRIFPIYYLCWTFLIFFNVLWISEVSIWHLTYLSNVFFYLQGHWGLGGHLWSLSTEEQFYVVWPIVMLFTPLRYLRGLITVMVLSAPVFRAGMNLLHPSSFTEVLTPALFDGLGLGALLALQQHLPGKNPTKNQRSLILAAGLTGLLLTLAFELKPMGWSLWNEFHPVHDLGRRSAFALLGVFLVHGSVRGFGGITGWLLERPVVLFLGKISYALYLFHNFQLYLFEWFKIGLPTSGWYILVHFAILLGAASLSWYLVELPINNLKKYFPYIKLKPLAEPAAASQVVKQSV
jgi:peptidoglycan/LPS O-acetylase OafA/YrhL